MPHGARVDTKQPIVVGVGKNDDREHAQPQSAHPEAAFRHAPHRPDANHGDYQCPHVPESPEPSAIYHSADRGIHVGPSENGDEHEGSGSKGGCRF